MQRSIPLALACASALVLLGPAPAAAQGQDGPAGRLAVPPAPGSERATVPDPGAEIRYPVPRPEAAAAYDGEGGGEPAVRIPSRITTRLRSLDAHLSALGARGGGSIVNAILSLVTGGVTISLGILGNDDFSTYLYIYGGVAAGRGILEFFLSPNAQGHAVAYSVMPMTTPEEVRERLRYGEAALSGLAEQALIARVLDGGLNLGAGLAVVPAYLGPKNFELDQPIDYFVLIGAGVSVISGIVTLASTSAYEQRWGAYVRLRDRLRSEREQEDGPGDAEAALDAAELEFLAASRPRGPAVDVGLGALRVAF